MNIRSIKMIVLVVGGLVSLTTQPFGESIKNFFIRPKPNQLAEHRRLIWEHRGCMGEFYKQHEFDVVKFRNDLVKYLATGVDINQPCDLGNELLTTCIKHKDHATLEILFKYNIDVNKINDTYEGQTHLQKAVYSAGAYPQDYQDYLKIIKNLVKHGADVNRPNETNGSTPLLTATAYGLEEVVNLLLEFGADPNIPDHLGRTVLYYVTHRNFSKNTIESLLSKIKCINSIDKKGFTPFTRNEFKPVNEVACEMLRNALRQRLHNDLIAYHINPEVRIIEALLEIGKDKLSKKQVLYYYVSEGYDCDTFVEEILKEVISGEHSPVNFLNDLFSASLIYNRLDMAALFLKYGADINHICNEDTQDTLLHEYAPYHRRSLIVEFLLKNGARTNVQNKKGKTPLYKAVCDGAIKNIQLFLDYGVDLNVQDESGCTPLHYAASESKYPEKTIAFLLERGSKVDLVNIRGETPLHVHVAASKTANKDVVKLLLDAGVPVDAVDLYGNTSLCKAVVPKYYVENRSHEVVETLLKAGANTNFVSQDGKTLLHKTASYYSIIPLIEIVLKYGADVNKQDENGYTPLHIAAKESVERNLQQLFLEYGANPDIRDNLGNTAADYAQSKRFQKLLLQAWLKVNNMQKSLKKNF